MPAMSLRNFGKSGDQVSALGLGGHHLGDAQDEKTAIQIVRQALDGGITFFDNCWEYNRGKSENWMGKVRFVGFTGHKDPAIHLRMLAQDFPFDTVQMPLNCFDATYRSFETQVLPEVNRRGMAALGMKSLGGSGEMVVAGTITPEEGLRYAMSLQAATTICGMESLEVLEQNLQIACNFKPMDAAEMDALRERCRVFAADGRYERFKSTKFYDADLGREQHGYPTPEELPL